MTPFLVEGMMGERIGGEAADSLPHLFFANACHSEWSEAK